MNGTKMPIFIARQGGNNALKSRLPATNCFETEAWRLKFAEKTCCHFARFSLVLTSSAPCGAWGQTGFAPSDK
jgi:hypothetical protein